MTGAVDPDVSKDGAPSEGPGRDLGEPRAGGEGGGDGLSEAYIILATKAEDGSEECMKLKFHSRITI